MIGKVFLSARAGLDAVNLEASNILLEVDGLDELVALGTFIAACSCGEECALVVTCPDSQNIPSGAGAVTIGGTRRRSKLLHVGVDVVFPKAIKSVNVILRAGVQNTASDTPNDLNKPLNP